MTKKTKPKLPKSRAAVESSTSSDLIGRTAECDAISLALGLGRNLLIEGPVGVGKTFLVQHILKEKGLKFQRVDGDTRYTEQKLTGWFDPPLVLKRGYEEKSFIVGPLLVAMKQGQVLFINELNRMPEAVQNILLPAMDERRIQIPKIGECVAKNGFLVIATQNPREFTATHALSEALLDRFEMIHLDYQSRAEELEILKLSAGSTLDRAVPALLDRAIDLVRATRNHALIKRGASVRAAIALVRLVQGGMDFEKASLMALPSRIEMVSSEEDPRELIRNLLSMNQFPLFDEKKKS